jgi:hypothetical protein
MAAGVPVSLMRDASSEGSPDEVILRLRRGKGGGGGYHRLDLRRMKGISFVESGLGSSSCGVSGRGGAARTTMRRANASRKLLDLVKRQCASDSASYDCGVRVWPQGGGGDAHGDSTSLSGG